MSTVDFILDSPCLFQGPQNLCNMLIWPCASLWDHFKPGKTSIALKPALVVILIPPSIISGEGWVRRWHPLQIPEWLSQGSKLFSWWGPIPGVFLGGGLGTLGVPPILCPPPLSKSQHSSHLPISMPDTCPCVLPLLIHETSHWTRLKSPPPSSFFIPYLQLTHEFNQKQSGEFESFAPQNKV